MADSKSLLIVDDSKVSRMMIKAIIKDHFPDSVHVSSIRTSRFSDLDIWTYAKNNELTIVTYDEDFYEWQLFRGYPPKIIWLRFGNAKTEVIAKELIYNIEQIRNFMPNKDLGILEFHKIN